MASSSKGNGPLMVPPSNFAMVEDGVYRSAYPTEANVPYLRHVGITHVVLLSIESLPGPVKRSLGAEVTGKAANGCTTRGPIRVINVADMRTWRADPINSGDDFSCRDIVRALDFAVDRQWHPVLFACPLGELQTNVLIGCMRRYQHWCLSSIFSECELFANVCRSLRSSLRFQVEAWDPERYPISAVNILHRNREMHQRDRSRAHQERRRHRRAAAAAAASLTKARKPDMSDSAEETEEDEDHDAIAGADRSATNTTDAKHSSTKSSPQRTFSEASGTATPPSMELQASASSTTHHINPEAALISTSGQRPPMMMRRAAAQRLRDQQQQQQQQKAQVGEMPHHSDDTHPHPLPFAADGKETSIAWAEWYVEALRVGEELSAHALSSSPTVRTYSETSFGAAALPPPHLRYADVRNPPALDSRSKFTKESIVEEDDD